MAVSKVSISGECNGAAATLDVVLPAGIPVAELLPTIVDLLDADARQANHWRLDHPARGPLRADSSLSDNGIRDGDLLALVSAREPPLGVERVEPWHAVIAARPPSSALDHVLTDALGVPTAVLGSAALAWTAGSAFAVPAVVVAMVGTVVFLAAFLAANHPVQIGLSMVAAATATGFLAVPSGPAAPNVFLAATAALCAALLTMRLSGRASPTLTAVAALALPTALATAVALPTVAVGAVLACASVTSLTLAPRVAAWTVGIVPSDARRDVTERAERAHATLSGLVAGAAAGGASGAVVVGVARSSSPVAPLTVVALISMVLLLRARTYADATRRFALVAGGVIGIAATVAIVRGAWPAALVPVAGTLFVGGVVATRRPTLGAAAARLLDRIEYVALAAVLPVASWAGGVADLLDRLPIP